MSLCFQKNLFVITLAFETMDCNTIIFKSCIITKEHKKEVQIDDVNFTKFNDNDDIHKKIKSGVFNFETDIIWSIALQVFLLHAIGIYGLLTFNYLENPMTTLWSKYLRLKYFCALMYLRKRFSKFSEFFSCSISILRSL